MPCRPRSSKITEQPDGKILIVVVLVDGNGPYTRPVVMMMMMMMIGPDGLFDSAFATADAIYGLKRPSRFPMSLEVNKLKLEETLDATFETERNFNFASSIRMKNGTRLLGTAAFSKAAAKMESR